MSYCSLFSDCSLVTWSDSVCTSRLSHAPTNVVVMEASGLVRWEWEFQSYTGSCGQSFIKSGENVSCFMHQPDGRCVGNATDSAVVVIRGITQDVDLTRSVAANRMHVTSMSYTVNNSANYVDVKLGLMPTYRCIVFPVRFSDVTGYNWTRLSIEYNGTLQTSALYTTRISTRLGSRSSLNSSFDVVTVHIGGTLECTPGAYCIADAATVQYVATSRLVRTVANDVTIYVTVTPLVVVLFLYFILYSRQQIIARRMKRDV